MSTHEHAIDQQCDQRVQKCNVASYNHDDFIFISIELVRDSPVALTEGALAKHSTT